MRSINKLLLHLDIFGSTPQFYIKHQLKQRTYFGFFSSLSCFTFLIFLLFYLSQELWTKKSPSVNYSSNTVFHPVTSGYFNNYEFMIGIQNKDYSFVINEKIFYARGFIFKTSVVDGKSVSVRTEIALEPCSSALWTSDNYEVFKGFQLSGFYCISPNQPHVNVEDIKLNHLFGNDGFQLLQVYWYECKEGLGRECEQESTIKDYLDSYTISVLIVDNYVQTQDYKRPIHRGYEEHFWYGTRNKLLVASKFIRLVRIFDDDHLFWNNNKVINSFRTDHLNTNFVEIDTNQHFVSFSLQWTNAVTEYYRKYFKLQDLAAQIGGLYKGWYIIGWILNKAYSSNTMNWFWWNEVINGEYNWSNNLNTNYKDNWRNRGKITHSFHKIKMKSLLNSATKHNAPMNDEWDYIGAANKRKSVTSFPPMSLQLESSVKYAENSYNNIILNNPPTYFRKESIKHVKVLLHWYELFIPVCYYKSIFNKNKFNVFAKGAATIIDYWSVEKYWQSAMKVDIKRRSYLSSQNSNNILSNLNICERAQVHTVRRKKTNTEEWNMNQRNRNKSEGKIDKCEG